MLAKKNRADKKAVEKIFKEGKFVNFPNLTFKFILSSGQSLPQVSVIVPKNIAKLATKRNFLRRRGYDVLKKHINQFPPQTLGVFVFKKHQNDALVIENEIKDILAKIN